MFAGQRHYSKKCHEPKKIGQRTPHDKAAELQMQETLEALTSKIQEEIVDQHRQRVEAQTAQKAEKIRTARSVTSFVTKSKIETNQ